MFAERLGGKFKEFPGLAKYVAHLKVSSVCTRGHVYVPKRVKFNAAVGLKVICIKHILQQ